MTAVETKICIKKLKLNPVFFIVTFLCILIRWTNGQLKYARSTIIF
jgi:hypothetical protein